MPQDQNLHRFNIRASIITIWVSNEDLCSLLYLKMSQGPPVAGDADEAQTMAQTNDDRHPKSQPSTVSHKVIILQHSCDTKDPQWARDWGVGKSLRLLNNLLYL